MENLNRISANAQFVRIPVSCKVPTHCSWAMVVTFYAIRLPWLLRSYNKLQSFQPKICLVEYNIYSTQYTVFISISLVYLMMNGFVSLWYRNVNNNYYFLCQKWINTNFYQVCEVLVNVQSIQMVGYFFLLILPNALLPRKLTAAIFWRDRETSCCAARRRLYHETRDHEQDTHCSHSRILHV